MKYSYQHVAMEEVMQNPEEYIIPECIEACKILWDKGICTYMCSNYENSILYVSIMEDLLSDENRQLLYSMAEQNSDNFGRDVINHYPLIRAHDSKKLCEIARCFGNQDSMNFKTNDEILDSYRRKDGEYEILSDGSIRHKINPEKANATLEEALKEQDLSYYDADEGKLFMDKFAYEHHVSFKQLQY